MLSLFKEKVSETTTKVFSASSKQRHISHIPCNCLGKPEVLVVDDNIFNIVTLQTLLDFQHSLPSDKAMNGQEAVEMVQRRVLAE